MTSHCDNSLDGLYISKNDVNEVKNAISVAKSDVQDAKQLVVVDFNEKCDKYFRGLFYNVDIENREITETLIAKYNLKVKNLVLEIQADYRFRLRYCDISYDKVAVWTYLLKIPVRRSSTPLAHQSNQAANPSPNFQSQPHLHNSFLDRSSTPNPGKQGRRYTSWRRWPTSGTEGVNTTMHHEVDQQHVVLLSSHWYQVDLDVDMPDTTTMTGGIQLIGITSDLI